MRTRQFVTGLVISGSLFLLGGCKSDDNTVTPPPANPGNANLKVVHASPNAPAVDIRVDGTVIRTSLAFPTNTGYQTVTAGARNLKVSPTGTTTYVIDANVTFDANKNYSVFAADSVSRIGAVVLTDDLTAPATGKAHVRFVHLSPNAPAVDIALQGGAVVFPNVAFKGSTAFTPLNAGIYDLEVRPAGSTSVVVLSLNGVALKAGEIYTVFARGFLGGAGAQALGAEIIVNRVAAGGTVPGNGRVLVAHASPNAPSVDLLVANTAAGTGLAFPNNTGYLNVAGGARGIKVNVTGTSTTVINANLPIAENANYTVFAVDSVSKISALVLNDTLTTPAAGKAHVRFAHLSPNAPAVDITLTNGTVVFGNRAFKQFTSFTPLDANTYTLQVRVAGTSTVVLTLDPLTLVAGKIYTVFAKGFLNGSGAQALGAQVIANN